MLRSQPSCHEEASAACGEATGRKTMSPGHQPPGAPADTHIRVPSQSGFSTPSCLHVEQGQAFPTEPSLSADSCSILHTHEHLSRIGRAQAAAVITRNLLLEAWSRLALPCRGPFTPDSTASLLSLVPQRLHPTRTQVDLAISLYQARHPPLGEFWDLCP